MSTIDLGIIVKKFMIVAEAELGAINERVSEKSLFAMADEFRSNWDIPEQEIKRDLQVAFSELLMISVKKERDRRVKLTLGEPV